MPEPTRQTGSIPPGEVPDRHWIAEEIQLGWYVRAIRQRWLWLVGGALLGAAIGVVSTFFRPVLYEGVTTLLLVAPPMAPAVAINPATLKAILVNGSIALEVITELKLNGPPHNLTPQSFIEAMDLEELAGTNVVRVRVSLRTPELAAEASRRLTQKAIVLAQDLNQHERTAGQEQLRNRLAEALESMNNAEKAMLTYQQQAQVELVKADAQAMLNEGSELLKLTIDIESEKARLMAAEQEIKRQDRVLSVGRSVGAEQALRRASEQERGLDRATVDQQRPVADPESLDLTNPMINPVYQTLDFQIATSRSRLAALEQERREIVEVRKIGGTELTKLNELYRRQAELGDLQASYELAKRIYSDLVVRSEEARTQAVGSVPQLQLVDNAIVPDRPLPAGRLRALLLGMIVGTLGAGLLALGLEGQEMRKRVQGRSV